MTSQKSITHLSNIASPGEIIQAGVNKKEKKKKRKKREKRREREKEEEKERGKERGLLQIPSWDAG